MWSWDLSLVTLNISMRELIKTLISQDPEKKNQFFEGVLGSSLIIRTETRYGLEILHQCGKRVKIKKSLGLISMFVEVTRGKTGRGAFLASLS